MSDWSEGMRILAVIPGPLYGATGDSVNERQLIEALSGKVDKVIVLSLFPLNVRKKYTKIVPSNIVLVNLPFLSYFWYLFTLFYAFITLLFGYILDKLLKLDFIYVRGTMLGLGLMLNRKLREKTIVKFMGFSEDESRLQGATLWLVKNIVSTIDRIVLTKCMKIIVTNALWVKQISIKRGVSRSLKDYIYLPVGVNLNKITRLINREIISKREFPYRVGFIGSLVWWQGVDILVKAVKIVQNKKSNVELIIIGDGPMRKYIENLAKALNVNFKITGFLPHEKALEFFSTIDVLVLPRRKISSTELNVPIKVIEAWALGIPVIVTSHKVFLNEFRNGIHVIYAEPIPEDVANKIILLLSNRELYERLSKNGPLLAKKFDYNIMVDNLISRLV